MASSVNSVAAYPHAYSTSPVKITAAYRLSDSPSNLNKGLEETIQPGVGSVKIEPKKGIDLPLLLILKKNPDRSDLQTTIIFNETLLSSLDLTVELSPSSSKAFQWEPFVSPEKTLPLPDRSVELGIQAHSKTSDPYGLNFIQPHFRHFEIDLKPRYPFKIKEAIDLVEGPEGVVNTWIDKRFFDSFKVSIKLLNFFRGSFPHDLKAFEEIASNVFMQNKFYFPCPP